MAEYIIHDEAASIAAELIEKHHLRLKGIKIAHLLRIMPVPKPKKNPKAPRQGKKITLASTSLVTGKAAALASQDYKFSIDYRSLYWDQMEEPMKRAVVDHELGHCGNDADGVYLANHDIEDFAYMIERHGLYKSDVERFVRKVMKALGATEDATVGDPATAEDLNALSV